MSTIQGSLIKFDAADAAASAAARAKLLRSAAYIATGEGVNRVPVRVAYSDDILGGAVPLYVRFDDGSVMWLLAGRETRDGAFATLWAVRVVETSLNADGGIVSCGISKTVTIGDATKAARLGLVVDSFGADTTKAVIAAFRIAVEFDDATEDAADLDTRTDRDVFEHTLGRGMLDEAVATWHDAADILDAAPAEPDADLALIADAIGKAESA